MMDPQPTRTQTTSSQSSPDGTETISTVTEYEAKHSIELGQTAKGAWYIKSLKLYGRDIEAMALEAASVARTAMDNLKAIGLPTEGS